MYYVSIFGVAFSALEIVQDGGDSVFGPSTDAQETWQAIAGLTVVDLSFRIPMQEEVSVSPAESETINT